MVERIKETKETKKMNKDEKKKIEAYIHCRKCIDELPKDKSPQEFSAIEVGYTADGVLIWCKRHDCKITHLDNNFKYKEAVDLLMDYWDSIPDEAKPELHKALESLGV